MFDGRSAQLWAINDKISEVSTNECLFFGLVTTFSSVYLRRLHNWEKQYGAASLMYGGSDCSIDYEDASKPLWSLQNPFSSQPSGSPQSQQPPTFVFSQTRWPLWSPLLKQSWQMIQVLSFSQSSHFQATSPDFKGLAQTPMPLKLLESCLITNR